MSSSTPLHSLVDGKPLRPTGGAVLDLVDPTTGRASGSMAIE